MSSGSAEGERRQIVVVLWFVDDDEKPNTPTTTWLVLGMVAATRQDPDDSDAPIMYMEWALRWQSLSEFLCVVFSIVTSKWRHGQWS